MYAINNNGDYFQQLNIEYSMLWSVYWTCFVACRTISQQLLFSRISLFARLCQKAINSMSLLITFNSNCSLTHCTYYIPFFFLIRCHLRWSDYRKQNFSFMNFQKILQYIIIYIEAKCYPLLVPLEMIIII